MIVLASKIQIPIQPQKIVPRPRLQALLEHQVIHHKLTLISAPAGYGKTTLLANWARASSLPVAWLSITGEEEGLEHFLRYLLVAWETVKPDIVETPVGLLLGSLMPDRKAILSAFVNAGEQSPGHLAFVLDDYHLIEDTAIDDAVAFLLDHLPTKLHFILASRNDPPLQLARYRARGQLLEIRSNDLNFTQEETADFMNQKMGLNLPKEDVVDLQAGTEGWVAGIQLAALAHPRRSGTKGTLAISGRQRFIADYLREDVLKPLPVEMQNFLLKTSLLDHLSSSLCDALTGEKSGQSMLETLERENLFTIPLDDQREWFRYHSLFADFLRNELARRWPDEIPELHRRAAAWYIDQDLPEQAFRHALAGDDVEQIIVIVDKFFNAKLNSGEIKVVNQWIESLPAAWYAEYPVLDLMRAGLLAYNGAFEACVRLVDDVEERLSAAESQDTRWQMARVKAVRCFIACIQNDLSQAEVFAGLALRDLPEEDEGFRPGVYGALGDAYRRNNHWEEAKECYLSALEITRSPTVRLHSAHVYGALADLELRRGSLQNAASYWRKALEAIHNRENWGRLPLPVTGWVYTRLGEIFYEWNQLADSWDHVSQGLERARLGGDLRTLLAGYLAAARINLSQGEAEGAADYLEQARTIVDQAQFPEWASKFERIQLELWLAQDRLRAAVNWSDEMLYSKARDRQPGSAGTQLAIARVLIFKGDAMSLGEAFALLEPLFETSEQEGRSGVTIEALALQALLQLRQGDGASAMISLEHALRLAEPEGYVRLFVDLGLPMARLLQEAHSRGVMSDYVEKLLAAFDSSLTTHISLEDSLPEPLTKREQEVLELVAAGLTNREIADELIISPETVKKHTSSIYGKLGASNRTEAAARARELDLLG